MKGEKPPTPFFGANEGACEFNGFRPHLTELALHLRIPSSVRLSGGERGERQGAGEERAGRGEGHPSWRAETCVHEQ